MKTARAKGEFTYLQLARKLESHIQSGTFRFGDRLPSVRRLCRQERVSAGTVTQALALLEASGQVLAKPRSGYYVRSPAAHGSMAMPAPPYRELEPTAVGVSDTVAEVFGSARSPNVVQLGAALPSAELLPADRLSRYLASAARRETKQLGQYGFSSGHEKLVRQLVVRMSASGCTVDPNEITITVGAMEGLNLAVRAVARPGEIVAVESPCFFGILEVLESLGIRALPIPSSCDDGINLELLEQALEDYPVKALVMVPSFSNPNGACLTEQRRTKLLNLLEDYDVPLIEDDVYGELQFGLDCPRPVKSQDTSGLVIYCGSFSKSLAPGLRIGWLAAGRYAERVRRLKFISSVSTSGILQEALADFLKSGAMDRHLRKLRAAYRDQVMRTRETILSSFPEGTAASLPQGAFYLWVKLPDGVDSLQLHRVALNQGISIAPGPIFSPRGDFRNYLRVSCGLIWSKEVEQAVRTIGDLVRANLRVSL